jgi:hypothetical protein
MNCDNTVNEDYWLCIETANNIFGLTAYCMMGCLLEGPSAQPLPLEYPSEPRILVKNERVMLSTVFNQLVQARLGFHVANIVQYSLVAQ